MTEIPLAHEDCLDFGGPTPCGGDVEYRTALSATGKSFPRCDKHWEERYETQRQIDQRYPQLQPSDFDPAYAGEVWDDGEW
jgi:hypothetical protein